MKKLIQNTSMIFALLGLIGCQGLWYQFLNIIVDIAPDRFVFEKDHEKLSIPIVTSHPLVTININMDWKNCMVMPKHYLHISLEQDC
jgi:hypothetical protein